MAIKTIDGELYRQMLQGAAAALENKKDEINHLNVFPVPDGDTGTNMSLTLDAVRTTVKNTSSSLAEYSQASAKEIMRAARGNSGVILSLFFRGMAKAFVGHEEADAALLTQAFRTGAEEARKAVLKPMEGTILTVMRECCAQVTDELTDILELIEQFHIQAAETLKKTPDMLPALKRAKVVDSGGCGFTAVLDGMRKILSGEEIIKEEPAETEPINDAADFSEFSDEEIIFAFCTECTVVKKPDLAEEAADQLRAFLAVLGDSLVLTEDDEIIKVHVHSNDPLTVLSAMAALGTIQASKIENMKLQHEHLTFGEAKSAEKEKDKPKELDWDALNPFKSAPPKPKKKYGVITVANGDGLVGDFRHLGVDAVIEGGQSMNPSTDDFLRALKNINCETAFLLPNNSNIVMAANQAAELAMSANPELKVEVIRTVTIPQGLSAMIAFNAELSPEENREAMEEAISAVTSLSITRAAKNAEANGLSVKKKQFIGLVDNDLRYAEDELADCLRDLAEAIADKEIISVYYGKPVKDEEAEEMVAQLKEFLGGDREIFLAAGQQPIYHYIISAE